MTILSQKIRKTIFKGISILIIILSILFQKTNAQTNEDCMMCHEDNSLTAVRNGKTISMFVDSKTMNFSAHKGMKCIACHKDAAVSDFPHPENLKPANCSSCHENYNKLVKEDIHSNLPKGKGPANLTCTTCHSTHGIKRISDIPNLNNEFCGKCHNEKVLSSTYHLKKEVNNSCKTCHKKKDYTAEVSKSIHKTLSCSNCHGFVSTNKNLHQKGNPKNKITDCYVCHANIAAEHKESIHGVSLEHGMKEAANCWNCHGSHNIVKVNDAKSLTSPNNLIKTCGKCHDNDKFEQKHSLSIKHPAKMYSTSVHGKLMKTGSKKAPNCTSCHGIHNIKNRVQPNSTISSINVPETCSKCHKEIAEEYKKSIHWIGVMKGISSSPSCNDCHSEHAIQAINSTDNLNMKKEIQEKTCLVCHESILLSERYGINEANASKYCDSYHGLAAKGGLVNAAMCIDCHGVHKILPAYSEESDINPKNLTKTCQKCHEEATDVFAKSYSHISKKENSAKYIEDIVRTIYLWLIIIVIGGMMIHNIIIFIHDLKEKRIHEKNQIRIPRFTKNELIQHTFLLVSFIMLSFSGFLLKFPGTWWADILYNIGIDEASRKVVHRVSAVVMIVLSLYHVIYLIATERGRSVLNGLFPRMHDIKAAIDNIKYYLRITNKHPEFENYNYAEKAEYWALIWGTIVMVFTGFVLWFPTNIGNWAPVWLIKVSEIIHYYEAILATLAIVVWHWFFVIFRPKEYPVNFVVADGQMTVEHYKHEHELRFKKVIMEWIDVKNGSKPENKTSHFTKLFISALEKNNVNVEEFFNSEIDKYEDLKEYVYKHSSKI